MLAKGPQRVIPRVLTVVLPVATLLLIGVWYMALLSTKASLEDAARERIAVAANSAAEALSVRIDTIRESARALADNGLIVNSLIDTQNRAAYLGPLFGSLRISGPPDAVIMLLDYRGRRIAQNSEHPGYPDAPWVPSVMRGEEVLRVDRGGMLLASPVFHAGSPEGILVVSLGRSSLPELLGRLGSMLDIAVVDGNGDTLHADTEILARAIAAQTLQRADSEWLSIRLPVAVQPALTLVAGMPRSVAYAPIEDAARMMLAVILISVLVLVTGIVLAAAMIARPLGRFVAAIKAMTSAGGFGHDIPAEGTLEMQALANSFNELMGALRATTVSRDYVERIIDAMAEAMFVTDDAGLVVTANPAAARLARCDVEALVGQPIGALFRAATHPDPTAKKQLPGLAEAVWYETLVEHGGPVPTPVRLTSSVLDAGQAGRSGRVWLALDVTEAKQQEAELQASETLLRSVVEHLGDGIAYFDPGDRLVLWNNAYQRLNADVARHLAPGLKYQSLVRALAGQRAQAGADAADTLGTEDVFVHRMTANHGRPGVTMEQQRIDGASQLVREVRTPDGGTVVAVSDVTDIKKRELDLRRSNEELEEFAYIASHDLQEPLRVVAGYVQLLRRRYGNRLDDDADTYIDYAVDGALRMQALINGLLEYSRVRAQPGPRESVDLEQVMRTVRDDLKLLLEESDAEVICEPLPRVVANSVQLAQVFQNLVANAVKFRGTASPVVRVRARSTPRGWQFSVSDNGIGISPKYLDRVFSIFKQLHPNELYPGLGIGLAICKKIVERHGGAIWAESDGRTGTTIHFTLPAKQVAAPDEPMRAAG